jgi:8-oxo-dGTP diphosphatase
MVKRFNIRVYGLWLTDEKKLLVSDELEKGKRFSKFPGGGLELGEGLHDALKREFWEEMGLEVEVLKHFYTTDFFQQSAFNAEDQLISIYYNVKLLPPPDFLFSSSPFDFESSQEEAHSFRLVPLDAIQPEELMFPIDKRVLIMLKEKHL